MATSQYVLYPKSSAAGTGTVTSVGLTVPAFLSVSGSPVSTSGTLVVTLSGTALPVASGGTGQTSLGNLTEATSNVLTITGGTGALVTNASIQVKQASTSQSGYLSSTDWNTFNNKQAAGSYLTAISVTSANGFAGSSSGGTTPALTLSTSVSGIAKGNGTALSAATAGTDYSAGTSALATGLLKSTTSTGALSIGVSGTDYAPGTAALSTGILKSTTTTGALSIAVAADFPTLNQNTTGTAANVTGIVAPANGGTGVANNSANKITFSGAFSLGLTLFANTNVNVPTSGSLVSTNSVNAVSNPMLGQMGANTIKGNNTGSTANAADLTVAQVATMLARQVVVGTPQTTNGTLTSTTFVAFTNTPTVSFTAVRSSTYLILCNPTCAAALNNAACRIQLNATTGTPTVIFNQVGAWDQNGATFQTELLTWQICSLTAGITYAWQLEGKANSGSVALDNASPDNGIAVVAIEIS